MAGSRDPLPQPWSTVLVGLAREGEGRRAVGSAGEEEGREVEEEGRRRGEEKGETRQSCGC